MYCSVAVGTISPPNKIAAESQLTELSQAESQLTVHEAAKEGNLKAVKQHLADGADLDARDGDRMTPLHLAAMEGHKEIVKLLIPKGADVNAMENDGGTPLTEVGDSQIADLLRKHGGKTGEELKAEVK